MPLSTRPKKQAQIFKALGHPTRILIVEQLFDGEKCVNDLKDFFAVTQPNISQHLNILKYSDIVDFHQRGNLRCYFLKDPEKLKVLIRDVRRIIK
jgi:ArsR family transcriptional regulator